MKWRKRLRFFLLRCSWPAAPARARNLPRRDLRDRDYVQRIALPRIESNHTYAVQARVEVEGRLRFINDARYAVITRGELTHVDLVLKAVGGPAAE